MKMVDENVSNQVRKNAVQYDENEFRQNAVQNLGIQIIKNMKGHSVVSKIANQYGNRKVKTTPPEGNGNGINVDDCVVAYMKYAAEARFVVRRSCQKRLRNGDVKQKTRIDPNLLNDFNMATNENNDDVPPTGGGDLPVPDLQTMEELCQPTLNVQNYFQFHVLLGDDANKHLDKFLHVTQSIKVNGVTDDALRLYLFPHSLTHHATAWFDRLPRNSITTFEQMAKMFLKKYFPPSMVMKLSNEITNFWQRPDESLFEAWERYKLSIDRETFMKRRPEECYDLIENMTTHHNGWDTSAQRSKSSSSITSSFDPKIVALKAEMAEINKKLMKVLQINQQVKAVAHSCETCGGPHSYNDCPATVGQTQNVYDAGAYNQGGTLPSNTVTNSKEDLKGITTRSGIAYKGPTIPTTFSPPNVVERETEVTKDTVPPTNNGSTKDVQPLTPFNEHCSAVLLKKLSEKLRDPGKFLIPCDFSRMYECLALADLGTSISLMPLFVWKMISLPELSPTCMTLELADRSISHPVAVAEDVSVKVGKFHFSADFVVVDFDADPRVPLILGRSFLKIGRALIDVYEGELTLRVNNKSVTFNLDQTSRYSANYDAESINRIDVIDVACEEYSQEVLRFSVSGNPTPSMEPIVSISSPTLTPFGDSDFLLEETDAFLAIEDEPTSPEIDDSFYDSEGDIFLLEEFLNDDPCDLKDEEKTAFIKVLKSHKQALAWKLSDIKDSPWVSPVHCVPKKGGFTVVENEENELIPTRLVTGWRVCIDYQKLTDATRKDHFPLPFMEQMLERLAGNEYY
uniref:Reverse transcriptase domain-containing protein n=1 Tax=Tanacetum cinerariifolium TaxID=118510 RepID=A0A6L2J4Z7_TANCI|nr:reverse transcriptase domain-containing protein [Tanacetum cinerariifolium]